MADRVQQAVEALTYLVSTGMSPEQARMQLLRYGNKGLGLVGGSFLKGGFGGNRYTQSEVDFALREYRRRFAPVEVAQPVVEPLDPILQQDIVVALDDLISQGSITIEQAADILASYQDPKFRNYIGSFASAKEMQDAITGLGLDPAMSIALTSVESQLREFNPDYAANVDYLSSQARVQGVQKKEQLAQQKIRATEATAKRIVAEQQAQRSIPGINVMNAYQASPYVTEQDRAGYNQFEQSLRAAAGTVSPDVGRYGSISEQEAQNRRSIFEGLTDRAARTVLGAQSRAAGEEQANQAYIAGTRTGNAPTRKEYTGIMPDVMPEVERYLKETGLEPGDKLRSFIESKLGEVVKEVQPAREAWLERQVNILRHEQEEGDTYEGESARIGAEGAKWGRIADVASAAPYTGSTYWGEGGLAGIAKEAYQSSQTKLAALSPGDYPSGATAAWKPQATPEVDPLIAALRNRNWESEYMRLSPAQRGVSYSRFTPRTTVRV